MSLTETTMSQPGCTFHHGVHCGPDEGDAGEPGVEDLELISLSSLSRI